MHLGLVPGVLFYGELCPVVVHVPGVGNLAAAGFEAVQDIPEPSVLHLHI